MRQALRRHEKQDGCTSLLTLAFLLFLTVAIIASAAITLYGIVLAFSASIVIGTAVLFLQPAPFILGLCAVCGHADIALKVATYFGLGV